MAKKVLTLMLIRKLDQVLLGFKKRGFGVNKWNGFGGKVNPNESICEAAVRELREESDLRVLPSDLEKIGIIDFEFCNDPVILEVHIFTALKYEGNPVETEEMRPKWFSIQDIPFNLMWPDDKLWFPLFLSGKKFQGYFLFQGHDIILKHSLQEVHSL